MSRLPVPGSDSGTWGDILNEFLSVEHNSDGSLKSSGSLASKADDSAVVKLTGSQTVAGVKTFSSSPVVPTPTGTTDAATKAYVDTVATSGAPDANATTKGLVQLAGDLSGTAASPQIASGVIVNADINASAAIAQSKVASLTTDLAAKKTDSMATNKLLGRGTAATGVIEEITLGTNLSLTGTTLNVSGGSAAWGGITGTLSSQTDLQSALDAKQATDADLTTIAGLSPSNDEVIQRKAGVWTNSNMAQIKTDLSLAKGDVGLSNVDNTSDINKPVSTAQQAAIDAAKQGLDIKDSVRAATTAAGALATSFENLDVIDGVTLATGDRILIKDQAAGAENGVYTVNASGAPTRAIDANISAEVTAGMYVFVSEGTVNGNNGFVLTTDDPITLGTTALVFTQFSGAGQITAGAGLTKTGNTLDVGAGSGISVAADSVAIDTAVVASKTDNLSVFAATTSAQLAGVVSDETGSGALVFATSPTLTTPTIGDLTNATHSHQNAAGGGTLDHGLALTGLTDDDHTQYTLLAGRSGGQTLYGGTASGNNLTISSTSNATLGLVNVNSGTKYFVSDQTFTAKPNSLFDLANTYTLNYVTASWGGGGGGAKGLINVSATFLAQQNTGTLASIGFKWGPVLKNVAGSGTTALNAVPAVRSQPTVTADTDAITAGANADFYSNPTFSTVTGGTLTMNADYVNFESILNVADTGVSFTSTYAAFAAQGMTGTGSVANFTGLRVWGGTYGSTTSYGINIAPYGAWGGAGTNIGVYIQTAPTGGTTNTGIHNAGTLRQIGKASFGTSTEPTWGVHLVGTTGDTGSIGLTEVTTAPTDPSDGNQALIYVKGDKLVIHNKTSTTNKYRTLDLASVNATWTYSTTAP